VASQTYPAFLEKDTPITGTFALASSGTDTGGAVIGNSLIAYKADLYAMKTSGTHTVVINYDPATNVLATTGTITAQSSASIYPQPFRHPQDDILYFGAGNIISKLDNTTFTAEALVLPSDLIITSLTDYGVYLAIACAPKDAGKSYVFLWGRDTSLTTVQETIDFGEGNLMVIDNVGGTLVGVSGSSLSASSFDILPRLVARAYTGGLARVFKEIKSESTVQTLSNIKAKSKDSLYFTASTRIQGETVNQIWVCKKNAGGQLIIQPDRLANNNTAVTTVDGLSVIGDYMWVAYDNGSLKRTNDSASYTATAVYDTLLNPSMPIEDRSKLKQLKNVSVSFAPLASSSTLNVQYRFDNGSYEDLLNATTAGTLNKEVVKTLDGDTFGTGRELQFRVNSTAAEVTEIKYDYTVNKTLTN